MTPLYKCVTKVNVTLQVQVQGFSGDVTLDEVKRIAAAEAVDVVLRTVAMSDVKDKVAVCGKVDVFSVMVKEGDKL